MPIHGPEGRRPLRDPYGTLTGPLGKHRPNTDPPNDAIWACLANLPLGAFQNRVRREVRRIYIYSVFAPMNSNKRFWGAVQKGGPEKGRSYIYI
jgi:hypothetical protein